MKSKTEIINLIIAKKDKISPQNEQELEDRRNYLNKKVLNKKLKEFKLFDLLNEYNAGDGYKFNDEWIDFFEYIFDVFVYNKVDYPNRNEVLQSNGLIYNSDSEIKTELANKLVRAIINGKDSEITYQKFLDSDFREPFLIKKYMVEIMLNINNIFIALSSIDSYEYKTNVLAAISNLFYVTEGKMELSFSIDFVFPVEVVQNPQLLIKELKNPLITQDLAIKIQQENIKQILNLYYRMKTELYQSEKGYEGLLSEVKRLNQSIGKIVDEYSVPSSFKSIEDISFSAILPIFKEMELCSEKSELIEEIDTP